MLNIDNALGSTSSIGVPGAPPIKSCKMVFADPTPQLTEFCERSGCFLPKSYSIGRIRGAGVTAVGRPGVIFRFYHNIMSLLIVFPVTEKGINHFRNQWIRIQLDKFRSNARREFQIYIPFSTLVDKCRYSCRGLLEWSGNIYEITFRGFPNPVMHRVNISPGQPRDEPSQ